MKGVRSQLSQLSRRKLVVGLTGGIATGKSTVLSEFRRLGAATVSTDDLAHELLKEPAFAGRVARRFGASVRRPDGAIDRKALGAVVFGNRPKLAALERLLHPEIRRRARRLARRSPRPVCVVDVPLLFEKKLAKDYDLTLAVFAPESIQKARLRKRDGLSTAEARRRIGLQWPVGKKCEQADVVLDNSRPWRRVAPVVREYYRAFELIAN